MVVAYEGVLEKQIRMMLLIPEIPFPVAGSHLDPHSGELFAVEICLWTSSALF
jgi:hypothetical protein